MALAQAQLAPSAPPATPGVVPPQLLGQQPMVSVLVAGDASLPVWDNAVRDFAALLPRGASAPPQLFTASNDLLARGGFDQSKVGRVLSAIAGLRPAAGEGCLVYATAHGAPREGLAFTPSRSYLTPAALDQALSQGCGRAPTVVIISGCYSGDFARAPMARPNRIVLTAARNDRPSFGCGAGRTYTVYDQCLLGAMRQSAEWRGVADRVAACVTREETAMGETPSGPQRFFGAEVAGLALPQPGQGGAAAPPPPGNPPPATPPARGGGKTPPAARPPGGGGKGPT
jgi:hypothetical protein